MFDNDSYTDVQLTAKAAIMSRTVYKLYVLIFLLYLIASVARQALLPVVR